MPTRQYWPSPTTLPIGAVTLKHVLLAANLKPEITNHLIQLFTVVWLVEFGLGSGIQ